MEKIHTLDSIEMISSDGEHNVGMANLQVLTKAAQSDLPSYSATSPSDSPSRSPYPITISGSPDYLPDVPMYIRPKKR